MIGNRWTALVLALYPRPVRERYGDEIAELLADSATPVRDLADVAWCALIDRGNHVTTDQIRTGGTRLVGLIAAPLAFGAALLAFASLGVVLVGTIDQGADNKLVQVIVASAVLPVGALAIWLGRRTGRAKKYSAPAVSVPVALTIGIVGLASLPGIGETLGEVRRATLLAVLVWGALTVLLAAAGARVAGRRRPYQLVVIMTLGALITLDLTFLSYAAATPGTRAPDLSPLLWYPAAVTGIDSAGGIGGELLELLKGLPAVLTTCTAFTLSLVTAAAARRDTGSTT